MHRRLGIAVGAALLSTLVACGGGGGGGGGATFSISGTVSGAVANGVLVTLGGSKSGTTTTASGGAYSFSNLSDGSYTLTPSLAGYTFSPSSLSVTVSGGDLTGENFTATAVSTTYAISGTVSGAVANGVLVTLGGSASGTTTTAGGGAYSFSNLSDGSYTLTPSLVGYTFSPSSLSVTVNGGNLTGKNFTATATSTTYAISGTVSGAVANGVLVTLSGSASANTTTAGGGLYSFSSLPDGSYTVTPSLAGYSFTPSSLSVTVNGGNISGKNFTAVAVSGTFSITGTVSGAATSGVTVKLSGTATGTTTTDSSGNYSFANLSNGSYTVTASRTGFVFGPPSLSVTVNGTTVTGEDFLAATLYDDFTSGLVASKWASGLRQGSLSGGGLVLAHSLQGLLANTSYTSSLQPITSGEVTISAGRREPRPGRRHRGHPRPRRHRPVVPAARPAAGRWRQHDERPLRPHSARELHLGRAGGEASTLRVYERRLLDQHFRGDGQRDPYLVRLNPTGHRAQHDLHRLHLGDHLHQGSDLQLVGRRLHDATDGDHQRRRRHDPVRG